MSSNDRSWREQALRSAVLAGDERAWRAWYDESYDGLSAYVCWRCAGLRDLAEEVIQETWLTAIRRIRSFDPERASFAQWLRGIAAHTLRNQLRRRAYRKAGSLNGQLVPLPQADPASQERGERVLQALADLPERYEQVLQA